MTEPREERAAGTRTRIIEAAAKLLAEGGRDAVSSRTVSAAAGVQAPTIYRAFGDMQGLLDEVASYGFAGYLEQKTGRPLTADPVEDLRQGWDLHVGFGLANPAVYSLIYGNPIPGVQPPAARAAAAVLTSLLQRVAEAGRLVVPVEQAAHMVHAAGCGVTLTLIGMAAEERDEGLSPKTRDAILAAVTTAEKSDRKSSRKAGADSKPRDQTAALISSVVTLQSGISTLDALSGAEQRLLNEWLSRIAATAGK